jgi:hypothetical protein
VAAAFGAGAEAILDLAQRRLRGVAMRGLAGELQLRRLVRPYVAAPTLISKRKKTSTGARFEFNQTKWKLYRIWIFERSIGPCAARC